MRSPSHVIFFAPCQGDEPECHSASGLIVPRDEQPPPPELPAVPRPPRLARRAPPGPPAAPDERGEHPLTEAELRAGGGGRHPGRTRERFPAAEACLKFRNSECCSIRTLPPVALSLSPSRRSLSISKGSWGSQGRSFFSLSVPVRTLPFCADPKRGSAPGARTRFLGVSVTKRRGKVSH